jgi:hypothetical protein
VPNGHLGAPALLKMLAQLLRQASASIEQQPDNRTPKEVVTATESLQRTAARADFLAGQIAGEC